MLNSQQRLQQSSQQLLHHHPHHHNQNNQNNHHHHQNHHHTINQQQHQHSHPHHPTGNTNAGIIQNENDTAPEYFIFDDLTSALQERSSTDLSSTTSQQQPLPLLSSSSSSSSASSSSSLASLSSTPVAQLSSQSHLQQHQHQQQQQQQHQLVSTTTTSSSSSSSLSAPTLTSNMAASSSSAAAAAATSILLHHSQQQQQQQQHLQISSSAAHQQTHQQHQAKCCFDGETTYHFKTLVPAVAAGAIIGKGGETIASVQKDSGARVKMSKAHDFYPGTTERVCLITGSIESITTVMEFIMEKIREKPDLTNKATENETKQSQDRDRQVKILVPNSTAGMIIGKSGAYIKQIKEESGSYVQISQKPRDITLQERCITIIGDTDKNKIACKLILAKIMEDPQSGTCLNVSYADVNGPVANFNPTGSPYASNQNSISSSTASLNTSVSGHNLLVNGSGMGLNLSLNVGTTAAPNPQITPQVLDHIKASMRGSGYSEPATSEVCQAFAVLAKYGILGNGVGLTHANGTHHATPLGYLGLSALDHAVPTPVGGVFGAIGQVNLDSFLGQTSPTPRNTSLERFEPQFETFRHVGQQATAPISLNNNSFGLATGNAIGPAAAALNVLSKSPTPGDVGNKETKNLEVREVIVGAILGPSGRNLVEIQNSSGATIQISKKGIFSPGTRNRIVTINGVPSAIARAEILIEQAIQLEESKRASQNVMTGIMQ